MRRDVFQAIADPTRREIITLVANNKSLTPNAIADSFDVSRQAISKHIQILLECGIIGIEQKGRERYCNVQPEKLSEVAHWIDSFRKLWEDKFNRLDNILLKMQTKKDKK